MPKKKITCKDCKYLVCIPDGIAGARKPSCCFFQSNHDTESDKILKNCSLFEQRGEKDKFELD